MTDQPFDPIEPLIGAYHVLDARSAGGEQSIGSIRFEPYGWFAHSVATVDEQVVHGIAALFRGRLLMATGPKDKVEIGAYHLAGDLLHGIWVPPGAKGYDLTICGRERSQRVSGSTFEIEEAQAVDQQPYTGRLAIHHLDDESTPVRRAKFNWTLHDGEYASFGLAQREVLVSTFNFEPNTPFAIGLFEFDAGRWQGTVARDDRTDTSAFSFKRA